LTAGSPIIESTFSDDSRKISGCCRVQPDQLQRRPYSAIVFHAAEPRHEVGQVVRIHSFFFVFKSIITIAATVGALAIFASWNRLISAATT